MRAKIRRLEKRAQGRMVAIPQPGGTTAKFPRISLAEAFVTNLARLRGEGFEPHPLSVAAANSTDPEWRDNFIANEGVIVNSAGDEVGPPLDLSE